MPWEKGYSTLIGNWKFRKFQGLPTCFSNTWVNLNCQCATSFLPEYFTWCPAVESFSSGYLNRNSSRLPRLLASCQRNCYPGGIKIILYLLELCYGTRWPAFIGVHIRTKTWSAGDTLGMTWQEMTRYLDPLIGMKKYLVAVSRHWSPEKWKYPTGKKIKRGLKRMFYAGKNYRSSWNGFVTGASFLWTATGRFGHLLSWCALYRRWFSIFLCRHSFKTMGIPSITIQTLSLCHLLQHSQKYSTCGGNTWLSTKSKLDQKENNEALAFRPDPQISFTSSFGNSCSTGLSLRFRKSEYLLTMPTAE